MKWRYRILKRGDSYIPQYRFCFIWFTFTEGYADTDVEFKSKKEAEDFLQKHIEIRLANQCRKVEVVREIII